MSNGEAWIPDQVRNDKSDSDFEQTALATPHRHVERVSASTLKLFCNVKIWPNHGP
jgi:hypothetical protein